MAPAFGADDYNTIQREGLAFVNPVDQAGRFAGTQWEAINGLTVFEANQPIADRLGSEGKLFGRYDPQGYEHTYPFCWRCDSPLIYYARRSWFVRTTAYKDRMVALNRAVDWHPPEIGQGRFGEWLDNNVDWALSRDRYWGTPLPAWVCDVEREHKVVIGSYEALADRAGLKLDGEFDPHKPYIDEIAFPCDRCDGTMHRVPEVIDAWFDSGAMPYAQWHFPFEHQEEHARHFPADYICEGLDQTRGWFYSLLAIAAGVSDREAYQHVIVNGLVLDAEGRKMSKRLGNVVDPWEAIREVGADALRVYLLVSGQVWLPKRFDSGAVMEQAGGFLNRLRNTYNFLAQYAEGMPAEPPPVERRELVDRWLVNRVRGLVRSVRAAWDHYDVRMGIRHVVDFCDNELSNWYVRLNRARFWAPDSTPDPAAVATLHDALITVARLLAPAAPFMSDAIHRNLTGRSVHVADFPDGAGEVDSALDEAMDVARKLASLARYAREDGSVRTRQPLARMRVAVPPAIRGPVFEACLELVAREVNVRSIDVVDSDADLVRLKAKPNFRALGKVYGKATPAAAGATARLSAEQLRNLEAGQSVAFEDHGQAFTYRPEDVVIEREVSTDWLVRSDGPLVAALDPQLTPELRQEGVARELVNRVQRLRKDAGYEYTTRVALGLEGPDDILAAARAFVTFIASETLAREIELGVNVASPDVRRPVDLDGHTVTISLRQHEAEGE
jgi:isoleucyl-tRNA synthetase